MNQGDSYQLTILVENNPHGELAGEHGIGILVEAKGRRILFDTGQTGLVAENGEKLGIDLSSIDSVVLSHGHYDHTGGLPAFAERNESFRLYSVPGVEIERYSRKGGQARSIGMPGESRDFIDQLPTDRRIEVNKPLLLEEGLGLTGPIPRRTSYEDTGGPFYLDSAGREPDPIADETALWLESGDGLIVLLGCGHAGVVNTITSIQEITGRRRVKSVVGGFHLLNAGEERLDRTMAALRDLSPGVMVPCHCTGKEATRRILEQFGSRAVAGYTGLSLSL